MFQRSPARCQQKQQRLQVSLEKVRHLFPALPPERQHYSLNVSQHWARGCEIIETLWWHTRRKTPNAPHHQNHDNRCRQQASDVSVSDETSTSQVIGVLASNCFFPGTELSSHAWQSSLFLFEAACNHHAATSKTAPVPPPTSTQISDSRPTRTGSQPCMLHHSMAAEVLKRFYSATACAHLLRNVSMSSGELWREAMLLYGATALGGAVADSSDSSFVSRIAGMNRVERQMRLMVFTTLLDGDHWTQALSFFRHMLHQRDHIHHVPCGYLFKRLRQRGSSCWQQSLNVLSLCLAFLENRLVAQPRLRGSVTRNEVSTSEGLEHQDATSPLSAVLPNTTAPDTLQTYKRWNVTLCLGLECVADAVKGGQTSSHTLEAALRHVATAIPTFEATGSLAAKLLPLRLSVPCANPLHGESERKSVAFDAAAVTRGFVAQRNWIDALNAFCVFVRQCKSAPRDTQDATLKDVLSLRQFILSCASRSSAHVLMLRSLLDQVYPIPSAFVCDSSSGLNSGSTEVIRCAWKEEKSLAMGKLGETHSSVSRSTGVWRSALTLLQVDPFVGGLRNGNDHSSSSLDRANISCSGTVTATTVSFFLRIGMPATIAVAALKHFRVLFFQPPQAVGAARGVVRSVSEDSKGHTYREFSKRTDFADPNVSPYASALLNVCQTCLLESAESSRTSNVEAEEVEVYLATAAKMAAVVLERHACSLNVAVLSLLPTATLLPLLDKYGRQIHHGVLYHAVAPGSLTDPVIHNGGAAVGARMDWHRAMSVVSAVTKSCLRHFVKEDAAVSVFSRVPVAAIVAVLRRASVEGWRRIEKSDAVLVVPSIHTESGTHVSHKSELQTVTGVWSTIVNAQHRSLQIASYSSDPNGVLNATVLAAEVAAVLLETAACRSGADTELASLCDAAERHIDTVFRQHKLKAPVHTFSPAMFDRFLPSAVFAERLHEAPSSTRVAMSRLHCVLLLSSAAVARCHASRTPAEQKVKTLFTCVKYLSRGERFAASIAVQANSGQQTSDGSTHGPLWCAALSALESALHFSGGNLALLPSTTLQHVVQCLPRDRKVTNGRIVATLVSWVERASWSESEEADAAMILKKRREIVTPLVVREVMKRCEWRDAIALVGRYHPATAAEYISRSVECPLAKIAALDALSCVYAENADTN